MNILLPDRYASPRLPPAPPGAPRRAWSMRFDVSLDEEHVFLTLLDDAGRSCSLGERIHHYTLLVLARLRLEDAARGIDRGSAGWVDMERLSTMIGIDRSHLNIQIFRARRQILDALAPAAEQAEAVERRRGEVRFGGFDFCIVRGGSVEGRCQRHDAVIGRNAV